MRIGHLGLLRFRKCNFSQRINLFSNFEMNQSIGEHCSDLISLYDNVELTVWNNLLIPVTFEANMFYIVPFLTFLAVRNIGIRLSLAEIFFMVT